jgi:hypothetical protein
MEKRYLSASVFVVHEFEIQRHQDYPHGGSAHPTQNQDQADAEKVSQYDEKKEVYRIENSAQYERTLGRKIVGKHAERKHQDQTGKGIEPDGETDLFVSELVGLEQEWQVGKDHPEGEEEE